MAQDGAGGGSGSCGGSRLAGGGLSVLCLAPVREWLGHAPILVTIRSGGPWTKSMRTPPRLPRMRGSASQTGRRRLRRAKEIDIERGTETEDCFAPGQFRGTQFRGKHCRDKHCRDKHCRGKHCRGKHCRAEGVLRDPHLQRSGQHHVAAATADGAVPGSEHLVAAPDHPSDLHQILPDGAQRGVRKPRLVPSAAGASARTASWPRRSPSNCRLSPTS